MCVSVRPRSGMVGFLYRYWVSFYDTWIGSWRRWILDRIHQIKETKRAAEAAQAALMNLF